ncbi:MAG: hypothetical protein CMI25_02895 [Opitutae bacterium]|nr:hypothetical protein [Opitutae bacterium]
MTPAPVAHHGYVVILVRPTRLLEEHRPGPGSSSNVNEGGNDFAGVALEEFRIPVFTGLNLMYEAHVPAPTIIGVSTGEHVHERIDRDVVDVAQATRVGFQFRSIGANPYDSPSVHGQLFSVRTGCVHKTKVPYGDVDPPVYPHAYSIGRMIDPPCLVEFAGADLLDQMLGRSVCDPIPIFVFENR